MKALKNLFICAAVLFVLTAYGCQAPDNVSTSRDAETAQPTPLPSPTTKPSVSAAVSASAPISEQIDPPQTPEAAKKPRATPKPRTSANPSPKTVEASSKPNTVPKASAAPTPKSNSQGSGSEPVSSASEKKIDLAPQTAYIDTSTADKATIKVALNEPNNGYVRIEKTGGGRADYPINGNSTLQSFALTMGSGEYKVTVLASIGGNQYVTVETRSFSAAISTANSAWLSSNPHVNWNDDMACIKYARDKFSGGDDASKIKAVYNYIVKNYDYDYSLLGKLPSGYLPNNERMFSNKSGICYDFSSLLAAMLRCNGVPTKLIIGHCTAVNGLHAWNEVYVDGKWRTIDSSTDACYRMAGVDIPSMYKTKGYNSEREN